MNVRKYPPIALAYISVTPAAQAIGLGYLVYEVTVT